MKNKGIKYRGPKPLLDQRLRYYHKWNWNLMPFGHARREFILAWLGEEENNRIIINRRGCPILKKDPDLKRLLKQGKLKMDKIRWGGKATISVLVLDSKGVINGRGVRFN